MDEVVSTPAVDRLAVRQGSPEVRDPSLNLDLQARFDTREGSSSEKPVHFGLGKDARIQTVEITWPSGVVQKLENLPADRYVEVVEK